MTASYIVFIDIPHLNLIWWCHFC